MKNLLLFAIPMIARKNCADWDKALFLLNATLTSVLNQNDDNFRILIGANDDIRPLIPNDSRISVVFFDSNHDFTKSQQEFTRGLGCRDAAIKKHIMTNMGVDLDARYIMYLDADDLIRSDLVSFVRKENHPVGYLLGCGYLENFVSGKVLPCPADDFFQKDGVDVSHFDSFCGSSVILAYPSIYQSKWYSIMMGEGHHLVRKKLMAAGTPALSINEPMCIYRLNTQTNNSQHHSNQSARLSKLNDMMRAVDERGRYLSDDERCLYGLSGQMDHSTSSAYAGITRKPVSLSYITTCKGRLEHLKRSLPLVACQPDIECVVVDYDCPDGAADWVEKEYPQVKVIRVKGVQGFNASHARNIGACNSSGEWLGFFDADILLDAHFFEKVVPKLVKGNFYRAHPVTYQTWGSIICQRSDFVKVGGYDEVYSGWGGGDDDFVVMLKLNGVKPYGFSSSLLNEIAHEDAKRTEFCEIKSRFIQHRVNNLYLKVKLDLIRLQGRVPDKKELAELFSEIQRVIQVAESGGKKSYSVDIRLPSSIMDSPPQNNEIELYSLQKTVRYSLKYLRRQPNPGIPKIDVPCI